MTRTAIGLLGAGLIVAATGCGDASHAAPACGTTTALLTPFDEPRRRALIDDVTGDGDADPIAIAAAGNAYRLEVGTPVSARIALPSFYVTVGAADLDGDGVRDLVVGELWEGTVHVFRGPVAGTVDTGDAFVTVTRPNDGGLVPFFGNGVASADVNGDGAPDLVITAPAEREEGCSGQLAPAVFYGPFEAGARLSYEGAALFLDGPMECLGEKVECAEDGLRVSVLDGWVCYPFPLAPTPARCAAIERR